MVVLSQNDGGGQEANKLEKKLRLLLETIIMMMILFTPSWRYELGKNSGINEVTFFQHSGVRKNETVNCNNEQLFLILSSQKGPIIPSRSVQPSSA